jgi:hypothetical protein
MWTIEAAPQETCTISETGASDSRPTR